MENREIVHRGRYNMDVCSGQADIYGNREKLVSICARFVRKEKILLE